MKIETQVSKNSYGRFLTFTLGHEVFGLDILKVVEIIGVMHITKVPRCAQFMRGVINLRGKIIPVIDLRAKFGLDERAYDQKTCIIITNMQVAGGSHAVGVVVDTVLEVVEFKQEQVSPAPQYGSAIDTQLIVGIGRDHDERVVMLISVDQILSGNEIEQISAHSVAAE